LGSSRDLFQPPHRRTALSENVSGWKLGINRWRECAILRYAGNSLPKFPPARINRLQAGQNAAVLIFDLGTVAIR